MVEAKYIETIKRLGKVYVSEASFDKQLGALREIGIKYPISVRDASYARLYGENEISKLYTRTCHAPICAKDSPTIIARISPLISNSEMASKAVEAHRNNQYPVFDNNFSIYGKWEKIAKKDKNKKPENMSAIILDDRNDYRIDKDSREARFFWKDTREDYFKNKVSESSVLIWQISVNSIDSAKGTIINYIGFNWSENESYLNFGDWNLNDDYGTLGVLCASAEGARPSKNSKETKIRTPSLTEILKYSKPFVPAIAREEFEKGLRAKYK